MSPYHRCNLNTPSFGYLSSYSLLRYAYSRTTVSSLLQIRTWLGDSLFQLWLFFGWTSTLACCPCNRQWDCWMLFGTYTPGQVSGTHTATSARIDRWPVSDSLVSAVNAATVLDFQPDDHFGVTLSLSRAATPPRGPGVWSMPPFIVSHPAFKTLMTAEVQAFMQAHPISSAHSRAVRRDQLKAHIQDEVLLHKYGDECTYCFHHLHRQRQQTTVIRHLQARQDSPLAYLCTAAGIHKLLLS